MADNIPRERRILLAVDESENSSRAVEYVGRFLGGIGGFAVEVVSIVEEPSEDVFAGKDERTRFLEEKREAVRNVLERARDRLIDMGVDETAVSIRAHQRRCENLAQCILDEQKSLEYGTLVLGRRGLSKSEEFLFGSVSSKIVRDAQNCTVWVVE